MINRSNFNYNHSNSYLKAEKQQEIIEYSISWIKNNIIYKKYKKELNILIQKNKNNKKKKINLIYIKRQQTIIKALRNLQDRMLDNLDEKQRQKPFYKRPVKKNRTGMILQPLSMVLALICVIYIVKWNLDNTNSDKILKDLGPKLITSEKMKKHSKDKTKIEDSNDSKEDLKSSLAKNSDTVAWLKVKNTKISYPVVKTSNNDYYLSHNLNKQASGAGWIFADYRNKLDGTDKNIIIYGHNRKNGSMFGTLSYVTNANWYTNDSNRYITYQTKNQTIKYEVFSIYEIKSESYYITTDFGSDDNYMKFLNTIKNRSKRKYNVNLKSSDQILTLSTCKGENKRIVLHAKKV